LWPTYYLSAEHREQPFHSFGERALSLSTEMGPTVRSTPGKVKTGPWITGHFLVVSLSSETNT